VTDELSPEQEADVRRLLAQARHDEPVPADVAARLDEALAGLVADEGVDDLEVFDSESAPVTDLAGVRHRRRKAGRLLLAAAAVVVAGVAVGQNLGSTGAGDADSADGGGDSLAEAPGGAVDRAQEEAGGASEDSPDEGAQPSAPTDGLPDQLRAPIPLTSENFAADVARELARTPELRLEVSTQNLNGVTAYASANSDFVCAAGAYGEGAALPAYYDAEEAVLVLRRPRSGLQRVDLLTCGTAVELNSVELPAP